MHGGAALELDGYYNFCRIDGASRLREMPHEDYWRAMFALAPNLLLRNGEAAQAAEQVGLDDSAVCVQIRGRQTEELGTPLDQNPVVFDVLQKAGEIAKGRNASALFVASRYKRDVLSMLPESLRTLRRLGLPNQTSQHDSGSITATEWEASLATSWANSKDSRGSVKGGQLQPTEGPAELQSASSRLQSATSAAPFVPPSANYAARNAQSSAKVREALAEFVALSRCSVLVLEETPVRCTFCMLAQLFGGMRPCSLEERGGAEVDYPWRALCRNTAPSPLANLTDHLTTDPTRDVMHDAMLERRCLFDEHGHYPCNSNHTSVEDGKHCIPHSEIEKEDKRENPQRLREAQSP